MHGYVNPKSYPKTLAHTTLTTPQIRWSVCRSFRSTMESSCVLELQRRTQSGLTVLVSHTTLSDPPPSRLLCRRRTDIAGAARLGGSLSSCIDIIKFKGCEQLGSLYVKHKP